MAPSGSCNLRAILRTTLALVDHFGDTEKHGAMLIELKGALEHAIDELDVGTAGGPAISLCGLRAKKTIRAGGSWANRTSEI